MAIGYNGQYKRGPNVADSEEPGKSGFIHAEINCLIKCDFNCIKKKVMYVTHFPCPACCKAIINADIYKVVYDDVYRDMQGAKYLKDAGVYLYQLKDLLC
jgi:dCMP deaminase